MGSVTSFLILAHVLSPFMRVLAACHTFDVVLAAFCRKKIRTIPLKFLGNWKSRNNGMDMKLNSQLIVTLRKQKAWCQQQLSIVSGVSLRTIQRVESEGNASVETIKSIASALETDIDKILNQPANTRIKSPRTAVLFTCIVSLMFSVFLTSSTTAATGIEIQAKRIFQSEDKSETSFEGHVKVFIPENTPFNCTSSDLI